VEHKKIKKLLILGPSYQRNEKQEPLPAVERYNGVFYKVFKKRGKGKVDILILNDKLDLIWGNEYLPAIPAKEGKWGGYGPKKIPKKIVNRNIKILSDILNKNNYDEVFIALNRNFRRAIEGIDKLTDANIIYVRGRGIGVQANLLKNWLSESDR